MIRHLFVLLFALALATVPALAQGETIVITEADINATYLVEASPGMQVSNVVVDLRDGELAISATLIPVAGNTIEAELVVVPSLDRGYLSWVVVEVLLNGQEAPDTIVSQINTALLPAWRAFSNSLVSEAAASVTIADDTLTIQLSGGPVAVTPEAMPEPMATAEAGAPAAEPANETYVFTETQANDTIDRLSSGAAQVANEVVDFQPGQVVISATLVPRRGDTVDVVATLVPETTPEAITWAVTALLIGGQPAPDAIVALVNDSLTLRWSRYIRQQTPAGGAEGLEITDDQMIFLLAIPAVG